jgi:AraC-like DNA-binding protein
MLSALAATDSRFSLSRFVERVSTVAPLRGCARRVDRLPDGRTNLIFRLMVDGRADVTMIGPRTHALLKDAAGFERVVIITFKPGWATPFVGVTASQLTDAYVRLEDLWGPSARDLTSELIDAVNVEDVVASVSRAFARRIERPFELASARLARRAARMLETENVRIDSVAQRLGVSSRHLRRAFVENIGIGPKDFARAVRLQRAVRLASTSSDWARIATGAGYYDQSHLIADFRDLVGLSPSAFLARTRAQTVSTHAHV